MKRDLRVLGIVAAGMCAFFDMYITMALLPELRQVFGAGVSQVSLTVTATTLAVAIAAPLAGALADRYGRRRVLLIAIALLGLATLLAATAPNLPWLIACRALQGLIIPGIFASAVAYTAEEWPAHESGSVVSLYIAGTVLGSFCGRFFAGLITAAWDWRTAFIAMGLINLAFLPLVAWLLPRSRGFTPSASVRSSLSGMGQHLRNLPLLATYAVGFLILFAQVATFTYINFHLSAAPWHLDTHALSYIFFVFLVGMLITPSTGGWARRWGAHRVAAVAMTISCAGLLLTLLQPLTLIIAGLILSSCGVFVVQAIATNAVPRLALGGRSAAAGLYISCYYLGGSFGASLPGTYWIQLGWSGCVLLVILAQAAAAAIAWNIWAPQRNADGRAPLAPAQAAL
jgi:predicted MFS family arabinose efflux permease